MCDMPHPIPVAGVDLDLSTLRRGVGTILEGGGRGRGKGVRREGWWERGEGEVGRGKGRREGEKIMATQHMNTYQESYQNTVSSISKLLI